MIKASTLIVMLRISICCGISLILLGIYLHNFNHTVELMGIKGIILSAMCVAFGMVLSLPTKMYLTLLLVNHENHQRELESAISQQDKTSQAQPKSSK
ncbi:hypothetical protein Q4601_16225 [Shewanella sp. 1_MG-2023]|uniref:hypothetical protein n=1 Tax=unclassified Shewanella TaxID=196818 RepID=UPI000C84EB7D|nr:MULTISPECIES: hypothetical protein [unclassified Shewanella]MCC4832460.1 hypothetical protein [Shewanella sp. 10N.7]MDO6611315.1 hypothetical protein [Shewanella sp. 7_MG-2023]MDO6771170.1 hypothetical protein [Shewanella sp. 2_MG-2023]MDO6795851.1 hypothetical protein [Shewanella sp. 1_MG-2023]PMG79549.1 hypothetical protein BCU84_05265 [Shewanella sp. 10N.286.51.B7]